MSPSDSLAEQKMLRQRLEAAHAEAAQPLSREEVSGIVRDMLTSLNGDMSAQDVALYKELEGLARYIQHARREIAALQPDDIRTLHIPTAHDELDAVVGATEQATFAIFDACDVVSGIAGQIDGPAGVHLTEAVTRIYEACNFQDVTGQRITKVVRALKNIEAKVDALVAVFGGQAMAGEAVAPEIVPPEPAGEGDAALLHGPQLPGNAISQDEIDRLLASFD
jgi:chemotaxis protein CheZ